VALGADGSVYFTDSGNSRVRKVGPGWPGFPAADVASADGSKVFRMDGVGRHLRTLHGLTAATLLEFGYDATGHLATVTDGDGNVTTVERDGAGAPTAIVGPFGQRTALALDANGYLERITNPAGGTNQFTYTAGGLLTSITNERGHTATKTYDTDGRLSGDQDPSGGSWAFVRAEAATGFTVTKTRAPGRITTYRTDQPPVGAERREFVLPSGLLTTLETGSDERHVRTDADGTSRSATLGGDPRFGMLAPVAVETRISTPGGRAFTTTHTRAATMADPRDPFSLQSLSETLALDGRTFTHTYQAASRTHTFTTPAGRQLTQTLDSRGRPARSQVAGLEPLVFSYDSRGRLSQLTWGSGPAARTFGLGYNSNGYLSSITDCAGHLTAFDYDAAGRLLRETGPDGQELAYSWDAAGNLTSIQPPGRPEHAFQFTPVNLLAEYTAPDAGDGLARMLRSYGLDRRPTGITRPDGQRADATYDPAGRLQALALPDRQITFGYSATRGQLTAIDSSDGPSLTLAYDGPLRISETWSGPVSGSVSRSYDTRFLTMTLGVNGALVPFEYDADGLPVRAGDMTLAYSPQNGLLTSVILGGCTELLGYGTFGLPQTLNLSCAGAPPSSIVSTVDCLGRIVSSTEDVGGTVEVFTYEYDTAGRLAAVGRNGVPTSAYAYDGNGNRITRSTPSGAVTATYDAQDRLRQYGAATYAYTTNGELQSQDAGGAVTAYSYDVLGNLRAVTLPVGTRIEYVVDGRHRRIGKRVDGVLVQGLLYQDGLRPVAELDGSGALVSRFVYGTGRTVPDYMVRGGATYRIVSDRRGSPRMVVDVATGVVAQRLDYDEFGQVLLDTNPGFQPFGFAGGLYDSLTRLVRFGARDYDAETGRWTAKDPIGFAGGDTNLYAYVGNDPVNRVDPGGAIWTPPATAYRFVQDILDFKDDSRTQAESVTQDAHKMEALQHCIASCNITREYGAGVAWYLGEAQELKPGFLLPSLEWPFVQWSPPGTQWKSGEEANGDRDNNSSGRDFGATAQCPKDCFDSCVHAKLNTTTN
jgi:RHS repeat-associated protein